MGLLILYVLLAVGVSFLCSIMEAVLLSVTPSYVAAMEQEGHPVGEKLRQMKEDIDRPLAAILSLNTVAHTAGAAGAGAQGAIVFGDAYLGVISAVLTLLILIFSEIIPKTLGAIYWRNMAPAVTRILVPTIWAMWPLVKLSKLVTRLLSPGEERTTFSREEFTALAEIGEEEGVFEEEESRILRNLFRFNSLRVKDVMTPRTVVFDMSEHKTVGEVVEEHDEFRFSRIPVYDDDRDDVTGYVLKDAILLKAAQEETDTQLEDLAREMLVVRDSLPLPDLLERLLDRLEHIALVVDEYGGVEGIVTMEDVVETLLGLEIVDEADSVEDMQALARQQWFKRAKQLGMVSEIPEDAKQEEVVVQLGITGGTFPPAPREAANAGSNAAGTESDTADAASNASSAESKNAESSAANAEPSSPPKKDA